MPYPSLAAIDALAPFVGVIAAIVVLYVVAYVKRVPTLAESHRIELRKRVAIRERTRTKTLRKRLR